MIYAVLALVFLIGLTGGLLAPWWFDFDIREHMR